MTPRSPRYESLTLWRGVACLCIVAYHSLGLEFHNTGGVWAGVLAVGHRLWLGVPLFFVISGYCITASADALRQRPGSGLQFFWRRFRRIYPPYWIWLGTAAVCVWLVETFVRRGFFTSALVLNPASLTPIQWLGNVTLTESWRWHVTGGVEAAFIAPSWSLCYEEQFYAVVGLLLLSARRFFFGVFTLVTALVFAGMLLLPRWGIGMQGLFLDGQWMMFASGALVYYVVNYARRGTTVFYCVPIILGGLYAAADPQLLLRPRPGEPSQSYLAAFVFALLLIALQRWDANLTRARLLAPLKFCGEMCYSLYLVHWPTAIVLNWSFNQLGIRNPAVVFGVELPLCVLAAVALARCFHVLVERRFLNRSPTLPPADRTTGGTNDPVDYHPAVTSSSA